MLCIKLNESSASAPTPPPCGRAPSASVGDLRRQTSGVDLSEANRFLFLVFVLASMAFA